MDQDELQSVCFICMHCNEFIKLHESFGSINSKTVKDLESSTLAKTHDFDEDSLIHSEVRACYINIYHSLLYILI